MKSNKELKALAKSIKISPKVELITNAESTDVYLYGDIVDEAPVNWFTGEEEEGDFIYPQKIRNIFEEIGEEKEVHLHLNSYGGDVYASVAIGNFIKQAKNKVNIYIDAIAASGASVIAMSADNLYMYSNSMMMIHRASAFSYGNTEELLKVSEDLKKFDEVVLASYLDRFKGTEEELTALIHDETYFTAKECLAVGLVDKIVEVAKKKEAVENTIKASVLDRFKPVAKEQTEVKTNLLQKFKGDK